MHYVMAKGILSAGGNMNLYRGCTHGCIYCDSRSRCYHIDHAFEDVEVKQNAVELLEDALRRRRAPCMVGTGSMTDPYLPLILESSESENRAKAEAEGFRFVDKNSKKMSLDLHTCCAASNRPPNAWYR